MKIAMSFLIAAVLFAFPGISSADIMSDECEATQAESVAMVLQSDGTVAVVPSEEVGDETNVLFAAKCKPLTVCDCAAGGTCYIRKAGKCNTCTAAHCTGCCGYFHPGPGKAAAKTRCCANQCGVTC